MQPEDSPVIIPLFRPPKVGGEADAKEKSRPEGEAENGASAAEIARFPTIPPAPTTQPQAFASDGIPTRRRWSGSSTCSGIGVNPFFIDQCLAQLAERVDGFVAGVIADRRDGGIFSRLDVELELDLAALEYAEILHTKESMLRVIAPKATIEDFMTSSETHFHLMRPIGSKLLSYVVLDRSRSNLALARIAMAEMAARMLEKTG